MLLNSFLLTRGAGRGRSLPIGFALRVLQEFLLASYLVRDGLDYSTFAASVRELADEISGDGRSAVDAT